MDQNSTYVTLNSGHKMPLIGYGTFLSKDEALLKECIKYAVLECGYRHIDTAFVYDNEQIIGEALKECFESGIKREDIFVTTKIWKSQYYDVEAALKDSLKRLQLDYIDLYLIHWMITDYDLESFEVKGPPLHEVWKNMEALQDQGLAKSIGVSN